MQVNKDHFRQLLDKYVNNLASARETEELFALIKENNLDDTLQKILVERLEDTVPVISDEQLWNKQFDQMLDAAKSREQNQQEKLQFRIWPRIAIAVSFLLVLSTTGYFLVHKSQERQIVQNHATIVSPGRNQATLTLANGQKIYLTKSLSGSIAQQGNTLVRINAGNSISYTSHPNIAKVNEPVEYNTLTTSRGEQSPYPLILADGTKVWLNAASSITYPTAFNGKERKVTITGEAYFEVNHIADQPFFVTTNGQTVEDIGTAFNVNAYSDEPAITTTLISGSVKVAKDEQFKFLRPGQQTIIKTGSRLINVKTANIEQTLAWKNGAFVFDQEDIESIMRKISRWYNVDVVYQNGIPNVKLGGTISRFSTVTELLQVLQSTGTVHFKLEGRRITVIK